jgi:4-amino-4-deoxy-L-arabinose transferase-like glycosyltransferase
MQHQEALAGQKAQDGKCCSPAPDVVANPSRGRVSAVVAIVVVGVVLGLPGLSYPYGRDQAVFALVGRTILDGGLPYVDAVDVKPPGPFYLFAAVQAVLGPAEWTCRLVDLVWQIVVALLIAALGRRLISGPAGFLAALLYLLCYHALGFWHTAQTEGFLQLPLLAGIVLLAKPAAPKTAPPSPALVNDPVDRTSLPPSRSLPALVVAGVLLGLAGLFKPTVVVFVLLALVRLRPECGPWPLGHRGVRLAAAAVGVAVPLVLWCVYAVWAGIWDEFAYVFFEFVPSHVQASYAGVWASAKRFALHVAAGFGLPWWAHLAWIMAAIGSVWDGEFRRRCLPAFAALVLALIGVTVQGKYYPYHVSVLLPWLALLAAASFEAMLGTWAERAGASLRMATIGAACLLVAGSTPLFTPSWHAYLASGFGRNRPLWLSTFRTPTFRAAEVEELATYVKDTTRAGDAVYVWGFAPSVYLLADRRCPTRFIYNTFQRATFAPARWQAELLEDLRSHPPTLVVIARGDVMPHMTGDSLDSTAALQRFGELTSWLRRNYRPATDVGRFKVLRRAAYVPGS